MITDIVAGRPLMASEVTRPRHQSYLLHEAANRYSKPSIAWISHICANDAARDLSFRRAAPHDPAPTDVGAELDEALSSEVIEIEL
jgi:hypothetical protein